MTRSDAQSTVLAAFARLPDADVFALAWAAQRLPYDALLETCRASTAEGIGAPASLPSSREKWALRCLRAAWEEIRAVVGQPVAARGSVHASVGKC